LSSNQFDSIPPDVFFTTSLLQLFTSFLFFFFSSSSFSFEQLLNFSHSSDLSNNVATSFPSNYQVQTLAIEKLYFFLHSSYFKKKKLQNKIQPFGLDICHITWSLVLYHQIFSRSNHSNTCSTLDFIFSFFSKVRKCNNWFIFKFSDLSNNQIQSFPSDFGQSGIQKLFFFFFLPFLKTLLINF